MKYAIISDIHGNYTAFVECLKKIEKLNINEIREVFFIGG